LFAGLAFAFSTIRAGQAAVAPLAVGDRWLKVATDSRTVDHISIFKLRYQVRRMACP
jgi:hypothetical protein